GQHHGGIGGDPSPALPAPRVSVLPLPDAPRAAVPGVVVHAPPRGGARGVRGQRGARGAGGCGGRSRPGRLRRVMPLALLAAACAVLEPACVLDWTRKGAGSSGGNAPECQGICVCSPGADCAFNCTTDACTISCDQASSCTVGCTHGGCT